MDTRGQYTAEWGEWHDNRIAELATPFGWLSVTGMTWLKPGQAVRWDDAPGTFILSDEGHDWVRFDLDPGQTAGPAAAALAVMGAPTPEAQVRMDSALHQARVGQGQSLNWITYGHTVVELLNRDGRVGIRKRDSKAPLLSRFIDIPTFKIDLNWIKRGSFVAFDHPEQRRIATAWPGLEVTDTLPGAIHFEVEGTPVTLWASGSLDRGLYINFFDYTNGVSTPAWRRLDVGIPDAAGGVTLDFNRAVNYPMAFTPYATCPAPVPENYIPFQVLAGERKPNISLTETGLRTPVLLIETSEDPDVSKVVGHLEEFGVELTRVNVMRGEQIPPVVGFEGLIVAGYDGTGNGGVNGQVELTLDTIADALAARIPTVALGNAAAALSLLSSPGWQSSMVTSELGLEHDALPDYKADRLTVMVSEDVAQDPLFRGLVTETPQGASYISVRDMVAEVQPGDSMHGDTQPIMVAWHKLAERFARMVHVAN